MRTRCIIIISMAAMLLMAPSVMGDKSKKSFKKAKLEGVWQMCFYVSEASGIPGELRPGNTFKVLTDDGRITNFTVIPNRGAILTGYGSYKQVADSIYHENIERSIHLPMLNNQVNTLYFEICDDKLLRLKFYIEKDENGNILDTWHHETWVRVEMPDKYPSSLVR